MILDIVWMITAGKFRKGFSEFDGCKGENLRRRVIAWECENQCCDIFVRVYLDRPAKKGFVIGWIAERGIAR